MNELDGKPERKLALDNRPLGPKSLMESLRDGIARYQEWGKKRARTRTRGEVTLLISSMSLASLYFSILAFYASLIVSYVIACGFPQFHGEAPLDPPKFENLLSDFISAQGLVLAYAEFGIVPALSAFFAVWAWRRSADLVGNPSHEYEPFSGQLEVLVLVGAGGILGVLSALWDGYGWPEAAVLALFSFGMEIYSFDALLRKIAVAARWTPKQLRSTFDPWFFPVSAVLLFFLAVNFFIAPLVFPVEGAPT